MINALALLFALAQEPAQLDLLMLENVNLKIRLIEVEYPKLLEQREALRAKIEKAAKEQVEKKGQSN